MKVKAGSTVKLTFLSESKNAALQHIFLLIEKDAMQKVADESVKAGVSNQFVTILDEVLVASKLTLPGEKTT